MRALFYFSSCCFMHWWVYVMHCMPCLTVRVSKWSHTDSFPLYPLILWYCSAQFSTSNETQNSSNNSNATAVKSIRVNGQTKPKYTFAALVTFFFFFSFGVFVQYLLGSFMFMWLHCCCCCFSLYPKKKHRKNRGCAVYTQHAYERNDDIRVDTMKGKK